MSRPYRKTATIIVSFTNMDSLRSRLQRTVKFIQASETVGEFEGVLYSVEESGPKSVPLERTEIRQSRMNDLDL